MSEELQPVDESVLTSLIDLRRERDALRQRLARMQEAAADLSEKVLARVRSDYESRIAALDAKAAPVLDRGPSALPVLASLGERLIGENIGSRGPLRREPERCRRAGRDPLRGRRAIPRRLRLG